MKSPEEVKVGLDLRGVQAGAIECWTAFSHSGVMAGPGIGVN